MAVAVAPKTRVMTVWVEDDPMEEADVMAIGKIG